MSRKDRAGGPVGVTRPFVPTQGHDNAQDDIAEALDHIARAISAIDHNLEVLVTKLDRDSAAVARVAASLEGKPC
jgi:multidrug resistance efflux pump